MRAATLFLALGPALAIAAPNKLAARQDEPESIDVPEGPLPPCSAACFGRWGWPITLCTGQEGLNHLIECFYDVCETEQLRIHAQLAAEQNCEEGMGWPDRMPEDLEYSEPAPPANTPDEDDEEEEPSTSASSSPSGTESAGASQTASPTASPSASASASGVSTGGFDVEDPSGSAAASASATESPNAAGARQTAYAGYVGVAAAAMGAFVAL